MPSLYIRTRSGRLYTTNLFRSTGDLIGKLEAANRNGVMFIQIGQDFHLAIEEIELISAEYEL